MNVTTLEGLVKKNLDDIQISSFWTQNRADFSKLHNIHVYPAKFPAFLVNKSISYAKKNNVKIATIADIFCGCGTTALESKNNGYNFWGIDRNPVATLITKVKLSDFDENLLNEYYFKITKSLGTKSKIKTPNYIISNERLNFWFSKSQLVDLYILKKAIKKNVPKGKYLDFFLCAFSNILKKTSRWLQKSIKPTIDKNKVPHNAFVAFRNQFNMMLRALNEKNKRDLKFSVKTGSILDQKINEPVADLLLTSPPYVTSYEYADLHQLSSIWLNYTDDYRNLRKKSIGSTYGVKDVYSEDINEVGINIVSDLVQSSAKQSKSVYKYFLDMKIAVEKSVDLIKSGGMGIFIIGNTEYKGVKIDNAKYLAYELLKNNMENIRIYKREIGTKILTRYRDGGGKFTNKKNSDQVYHCEFVVTFQKK